MNYKELEQEVKRLEEQIKDLKVKLEEKAEKKPYEVEVPEDIGDYYFVSELGAITLLKDVFFSAGYEKVYQRGLAFKTKEEAEQNDKERILLFKLHKWAEECNEGWTPDWQKGIPKYFAMFNRVTGEFSVGADCYCRVFTKLPYFKSDDLAEQFIEEFGDEIKEVFC